MKRKILSVIALVLALMMIVSCGSGGNDKATPEPSAPTEEPTPEVTEEPEVVLDLEGRTIRYAAWWEMSAPERGQSAEGDRAADLYEAMMEKYNFKWEYVQTKFGGAEAVPELSASVMSNDPLADITTTEIGWIMPLAANHLVQPLDEFEYIDFSEEKWNPTATEAGTFQKKVFGTNYGGNGVNLVMYVNNKMVEKAGLDTIYSKVFSDQWNWDTYLEYCQKTTKDTDNDGQNDEFGCSAEQEYIMMFIHSNDGAFASYDEEGKPVYAICGDASAEAHQYVADLKQVYKVAQPQPTSYTWDYYLVGFKDGFVMSTIGGYYWANDPGYFADCDFMGIVPTPMGPRANEYHSLTIQINLISMVEQIAEPEEVAFILDKMTDPDPEADPEAWKAVHEPNVKDEESLEIVGYFLDGTYTTRPDTVYAYSKTFGSWYSYWDQIINKGSITVAQAFDEMKLSGETNMTDEFAEWDKAYTSGQ